VLAVFSASALQQPKQASPERVGEYSQTPPFYRALWKSVNKMPSSPILLDKEQNLSTI
jgi:hypothetical protein